MGNYHDKAPYHWRAGHGYIPPVMADGPSSSRSNQYYAPLPFTVGAPPMLFGHGAQPPVYGGLNFPLGPPPAYRPPGGYYYDEPTPPGLPWQVAPVAATATATDDEESDSDDDSDSTSSSGESNNKSNTAPVGSKLPGGVRKGTGVLYTGRPCHLHVIDGGKISFSDLLNGTKLFRFTRHIVQDNSTVSQVIEALGAGDGASVTQVWEWGEGCWKRGSRMKHGDDKAGQRLSDLGWSDAGSKGHAPVWLYFRKK